MRFYSLFIYLIQVLLYPLIAWQGKILRKKVLKLPEAKGRRAGTSGFGPILKLLVVGDSSACGVGVDKIEEALCGQLISLLNPKYSCHWTIKAKSGFTECG